MEESYSGAPAWWNDEHTGRWDRVKAAFRRDWEQTKNDFGSDSARDLQQSASDTFQQATGKQPLPGFDQIEPALRYGYGAQAHYGTKDWDSATETRLRADYPGDYDRDREYVRRGYEYRGMP